MLVICWFYVDNNVEIDDVAHLRMLNDSSHLKSFPAPFDLPPPMLLIVIGMASTSTDEETYYDVKKVRS